MSTNTITVLLPGHVVRVRGKEQLYVVIGINAKTVSAAPLGGSQSYIRAPHSALEVVRGTFKVKG